eukprot:12398885-Karenia_brevis.AAC.1
MHLPAGGIIFWSQVKESSGRQHTFCAQQGHRPVVDVAFIDDDCIMIAAKTAKQLDRSIRVTLRA